MCLGGRAKCLGGVPSVWWGVFAKKMWLEIDETLKSLTIWQVN